ncbi:MAG: hypothetical protein M3Z02_01900 [Actinomycetota bacterium]|nr:hypothetical protein [Actinomycetota bacterium]
MSRRALDTILTAVGGMLVLVLLVAGGLAMWGYSFANGNVHDQLVAEKVFFPAAGSAALDPKEFPDLQKYAGQQLTSGEQAKAYADGFIGRHLKTIAAGKTYAEVSTAAQANPTDTALAAKAQTLFRGETLRGLLLNAYAFWKIGQLALIAAISSFVLAGLMLILSLLGVRHLRRMAQTEAFITSPELVPAA